MGVEKPSFEAMAVFDAILEAILRLLAPPPGASKNNSKGFKTDSKVEAFFDTRFEALLKPPGRLLGLILGGFWARCWTAGRDQ